MAPPAVLALRQATPMVWRSVICIRCCRELSTTPAVASGHNRWSKIRHEKGAADAKKTALRANFTRSMTLYSQMYGADPALNPQLAAVVAQAKKAGVPKTVIEAAIARGQGRTASGAHLDAFTYEVVMPPAVALVIEVETESKARALQELGTLVKRRGAAAKPSRFFFARRGRVVLGSVRPDDAADNATTPDTAQQATAVSVDDILEDAIEAGAEDVEIDDDDNLVVWTPPNQTVAVVTTVAPKHQLPVLSADTIWAANEDTRAQLRGDDADQPSSDLRKLIDLLQALRAYPDVRAIFANAMQGDVSDEVWQQVAQELDW